LEEAELRLESTLGPADESREKSLNALSEGVGEVGEGLTKTVEDSTKVLVKRMVKVSLASTENVEVSVDVRGVETSWWHVCRSVHGLLLGLDVTEEGDKLSRLGDPGALLGLLVVSETGDLTLGGVVVMTELVTAEFGDLAVDSCVEGASSSLVFLNHFVKGLGEVDKLSNTTTGCFDTIEGGEDLVELSNVGHDGTLIRARKVDNILSIEKTSNVEVLLGNIEGKVEISKLVFSIERVVINEVRTMSVDQSTESKTVLEGDSEVLNIDVVIRLSLSSSPQEKTLLSGDTFFT